MKRSFIILFTLAFSSSNLFGVFGIGDIVYDPQNHALEVTHQAQTLAQWAENLKRLQEQISIGVDTLEQIKHTGLVTADIQSAIGDWKSIVDGARSIEMRVDRLTEDFGIPFKAAVTVDDGDRTLVYSNHDIYIPIEMRTYGGKVIDFDEREFRRYGAVESLNDNMITVFEQTDEAIKNVMTEIGETIEDVANAETQAETDKLAVRLNGLHARLLHLQGIRDDQLIRLQAQQILNQNQKEKEEKSDVLRQQQTQMEQNQEFAKIKTGGKFR